MTYQSIGNMYQSSDNPKLIDYQDLKRKERYLAVIHH